MTSKRPCWIITGLAVLGDHRLRLLFEDGTLGDVDFARDDWPGVLAPLKDPAYFATVVIANGTLYWPEHDLDLAPEPLYEQALKNPVVGPGALSNPSGPREPRTSSPMARAWRGT